MANNDAAANSTAHTVTFDAATAPIHAVTVFQVDHAEVFRRISVRLRAGQNIVDVLHLPSCLDQDSIRVDGIGAATIFDVVYRPPPPLKSDDDHSAATANSSGQRLAELTKTRAALTAHREALDRQREILDAYSRTLAPKDADTAALGGFLDAYLERMRSIHAASTAVDEQIAAVDRDLRDERQRARTDAESRKRAVTVSIVVLADEDGDAELALSYAVSGASWTPLYDVRAYIAGGGGTEEAHEESGGEKKKGKAPEAADQHSVRLHYRASISQHTGEPWENVALTLSTASPQLGSDIPTMTRLTIFEDRPFHVLKSATMSKRKSMSFGMAMPRANMLDHLEAQSSSLSSLARPVAKATQTGMSANFEIQGLSNIPSDGDDDSSQTHKVSIAELEFENVELEWISVPKEQATVFLQCKVKNTSTYPLLPGQSSVFFGNSFVARSSIPHVAPQESFTSSLGPDGAVRVTYHPQSRTLMRPTAGSMFAPLASKTQTTAFAQRISIRNARLAPLSRLVVRDQVPVSADARFNVAVLQPADLPVGPACAAGVIVASASVRSGGGSVVARYTLKNDDAPADGERGDGTLEWLCVGVAAGAAFDLHLEWEVSAPVG
ncbi:hypothetical protein HK405_010875, partial [Cladochytrium tenue]